MNPSKSKQMDQNISLSWNSVSKARCMIPLTAAIVSRSNTLQQYLQAFAFPYFDKHSSTMIKLIVRIGRMPNDTIHVQQICDKIDRKGYKLKL